MLAFFWGRGLIEAIPPAWSAAGFTAVFVAMCMTRPVIGFTSNWAAIAEAILAAVVVAYLAYGALGPMGRLFDHPIVRFYGRISYSFYLLHPLTLIVLWRMPDEIGSIVQWGVPTALVAFGLTAITTVAITPLAWLTYHYVERPGVTLGRAATRRLLR
jgi:peptidoglycan/LPS O-acetylase OafA/YrhL